MHCPVRNVKAQQLAVACRASCRCPGLFIVYIFTYCRRHPRRRRYPSPIDLHCTRSYNCRTGHPLGPHRNPYHKDRPQVQGIQVNSEFPMATLPAQSTLTTPSSQTPGFHMRPQHHCHCCLPDWCWEPVDSCRSCLWCTSAYWDWRRGHTRCHHHRPLASSCSRYYQ